MRSILISAALAILRQLIDKRVVETLAALVLNAATSPLSGSERRHLVLDSLYNVYTDLAPALEAAGSALVRAALELLVAKIQNK
jgi:hypothetical protein